MAGVDSSFQVLYTGEVPTTPIRLGQLLVNEALAGDPLTQCTNLSPLTYSVIPNTTSTVTITGAWTFSGLTTTFGNPATITLGNTGTNNTVIRLGQGASNLTAGFIAGIGTSGQVLNDAVVGDLVVRTDGSSIRFTVDSGASTALHIGTGTSGVRVKNGIHANSAGVNDNPFFSYSNAASTSNYWSWYNNSGSTRQGYIGLSGSSIVLEAENSLPLSLRTGSTQRLAIDSAGGWTINGALGTAGQVLTSNGATTPTWQTPAIGPSLFVQATDLSIVSNAVFQNTSLVTGSLAVGIYAWEAFCAFTVDAAPGMQIQPQFTGTLTDARYLASSSRVGTSGASGAASSIPSVAFSSSTSGDVAGTLAGTFTVTVAGVFSIQAAQIVSNVSAILFEKGSWLRVTKLS